MAAVRTHAQAGGGLLRTDKAPSAELRGGQGRSGLEAGSEPFSLADYAKLAQTQDLSAESIYRAIVCDLPRSLHQLDAKAQR